MHVKRSDTRTLGLPEKSNLTEVKAYLGQANIKTSVCKLKWSVSVVTEYMTWAGLQ